MSSRYLTNISLAVAAGFIVVCTQAFSMGAVQWLAFALGVFTLGVIAWGTARPRGEAQRVLDGMGAVLGAWLIVQSFAFAGTTLQWVSFGCAMVLAGFAVAGLTLHELKTERVVHSIQVSQAPMTDHAETHSAIGS